MWPIHSDGSYVCSSRPGCVLGVCPVSAGWVLVVCWANDAWVLVECWVVTAQLLAGLPASGRSLCPGGYHAGCPVQWGKGWASLESLRASSFPVFPVSIKWETLLGNTLVFCAVVVRGREEMSVKQEGTWGCSAYIWERGGSWWELLPEVTLGLRGS